MNEILLTFALLWLQFYAELLLRGNYAKIPKLYFNSSYWVIDTFVEDQISFC